MVPGCRQNEYFIRAGVNYTRDKLQLQLLNGGNYNHFSPGRTCKYSITFINYSYFELVIKSYRAGLNTHSWLESKIRQNIREGVAGYWLTLITVHLR